MNNLKIAALLSALIAASLVTSGNANADSGTDTADYVRVFARHAKARPNDPVQVSFSRFRVLKARFDPDNLAGGSAQLEIDLTSLGSGSRKRDKHLQSPDYLDVASERFARVKVYGVAKEGANRYRAKADVRAHGVVRTWPVTLEVVDRTGDAVRVKVAYTFSRSNFGIGKESGDPVADELRAEALLTVSKR